MKKCVLAVSVGFGIMLCGLLLSSRTVHGQTGWNKWVVERAQEWDQLFDRNSGWTGADGIYSIPLSGVDAPGSAAQTETLFVFGDTFIGDVGPTGQRLAGTTMVNNTTAFLQGGAPNPANMDFFWGENSQGNPDAVFIPDTPNTNPGDWYWLSDGISLNGVVYLFASRMTEGSGGVFNFAVDGVSLISFPANSPDPFNNYTQVDAPLYYVPTDGRGEIIFGNGIMANTVEAGAPAPDGYIYIYGHQNDPSNKKLVVARVLPENFDNFSEWRYWNGTGWGPNIWRAAPLTDRISSEFSVSPLPDGRFILVFQLDTLSRFVAIRIGASPVGPFGGFKKIWNCPEPDFDPDIYTYNAKAHPHLSQPNELLISYNVNSFAFGDHFTYADIYRPRFIRIRLRR
ncbi:MAG: DUF4185 domain-containing protein [Candidatus Abyssobacteria bacterium SURF_17]|uniref:DUF4185 domain-containing protein n=1 Tax=Candidatus Abyssobacteria bacterium SURF_17 TaxID=2093361 RepID=A0A419F345_9BACT|nr:MAG: DUF4185 domain-containing protein [Candidatus Abyssubacteria bacterium SURF_17]